MEVQEQRLVTAEDIDAINAWAVRAPNAAKDQTHLAALADLRIDFNTQLANMLPGEQREELKRCLTPERLRTLQRIGTYARWQANKMSEAGGEKEMLSDIASRITALHARLVQANLM